MYMFIIMYKYTITVSIHLKTITIICIYNYIYIYMSNDIATSYIINAKVGLGISQQTPNGRRFFWLVFCRHGRGHL